MSTPKIYSKTTIRLLIMLTGIALMGSSCISQEDLENKLDDLTTWQTWTSYDNSSQEAISRYFDWFNLQNKYFQDTQAEARHVIEAFYNANWPCKHVDPCSAAIKDKYDHLSQLITSQYDLDQSAEQSRCIARESNCRENQRWALMNDPLYGKITPPPSLIDPETGRYTRNGEAQGASETQPVQYQNMNQQGVPVVPVIPPG